MGNKTVLLKQRVRTNILVALGAIVAVSGLLSSQTFAATQTASVNNSTNVLKISPVRTDVSIAPGASAQVPVTVTNLTTAAINVSAIENDFVAKDESGTPALILDADQYAPTHSLKRFMTPIPDNIIPAENSKIINVTITVPKTAQAGGYFGALRFAPSVPGSGAQVNLSASVASLILLTVPGPTVEQVNLTNFNVQQDGKNGTNFRTPNNLQVYARFENKGNLQEAPFGKVAVQQGHKVIYETDFNVTEPRDEILPDSARYWDIPLSKIGTIGKFTVVATFTYGSKNQTIDITKSFWVVPTWAIIAAIVIVLVLAGVAFLIVFNVRRRHRRSSARRGGNLRY